MPICNLFARRPSLDHVRAPSVPNRECRPPLIGRVLPLRRMRLIGQTVSVYGSATR